MARFRGDGAEDDEAAEEEGAKDVAVVVAVMVLPGRLRRLASLVADVVVVVSDRLPSIGEPVTSPNKGSADWWWW